VEKTMEKYEEIRQKMRAAQ